MSTADESLGPPTWATLVSSPCWCGFPHWWDRPMVELDGTIDDHPVEPWRSREEIEQWIQDCKGDPGRIPNQLDALVFAGLPIDAEFRRRMVERLAAIERWLKSMPRR